MSEPLTEEQVRQIIREELLAHYGKIPRIFNEFNFPADRLAMARPLFDWSKLYEGTLDPAELREYPSPAGPDPKNEAPRPHTTRLTLRRKGTYRGFLELPSRPPSQW